MANGYYDDNGKITPGKIGEYKENADEAAWEKMYAWDASRRFIEGLQYGRRQTDGTWLTATPRPGVVRLTINLLLPIYNRLYAMLAVATPHVSARPASASREDLVKAKSDAALVQYVWDSHKFSDRMKEANKWLITCGNVGLHTYYCKDDKKVKLKVISPYNLLVQPGAEKLEDSDWLIVREYVTKAELKRRYPKVKFDELTPVEFSREARPYLLDYNQTSTYKVERYEILEYWDRNGTHMITTGDQVLYKDKGKDWDGTGRWPVEHMTYHSMPGRFHGVGAIEPLISSQREYNAQRSSIVSNTKLLGNVQWLNPINSGVERITNEPGSQIRYNPSAPPPQQASPAPLPGYIIDNVGRTQSEMMDLAGIHGASLGKRVSGVQSGAAINALVNQDISQLKGVQDSIEQAAVRVAERILVLAKKYFSKGMMVRMFNIDGGMFYKNLKDTDLSEQPDIFFEAGSLFAQTTENRERKALQMFQLQLISPEEARRAINFFGMDSQIAQTVRSYNYALDVLEAVLEGAAVEIMPTDPLKEMLEVFAEFSVSSEMEELPPEIQASVNDVYRAVVAQGNPQAVQELSKPVYPVQQPQQPQQPGGVPGLTGGPLLPGESIPQEQAGGTSQGAINREQGKREAAIFEAPAQGGGFG